jgi:nitronate monooxygenase
VTRADAPVPPLETALTRHAGVELPVICGAMYPCSNPELVGAVSAAGGLGVYQPISLTYVHGHDHREGIRLMQRLAGGRPVGMNALIERSSRTYHERMVRWVHEALAEGVRFFVTSLGNPRWVAEAVHAAGGVVYHDVTELRWGLKGLEAGVDGLIAVNRRAGGHAGARSAEALLAEVAGLGLPVVCAGGISTPRQVLDALDLGYAGVQMGTRFIATPECTAHEEYKRAIVAAAEDDIVLTERLTGVPVAVINTPGIRRMGLKAGPLARLMFRGRRTKHWIRSVYALRSIVSLKRSHSRGDAGRDYWQAGRSVAGIDAIEPVAVILDRIRTALTEHARAPEPLSRP